MLMLKPLGWQSRPLIHPPLGQQSVLGGAMPLGVSAEIIAQTFPILQLALEQSELNSLDQNLDWLDRNWESNSSESEEVAPSQLQIQLLETPSAEAPTPQPEPISEFQNESIAASSFDDIPTPPSKPFELLHTQITRKPLGIDSPLGNREPLEPIQPITEPITELITEPITEPITEIDSPSYAIESAPAAESIQRFSSSEEPALTASLPETVYSSATEPEIISRQSEISDQISLYASQEVSHPESSITRLETETEPVILHPDPSVLSQSDNQPSLHALTVSSPSDQEADNSLSISENTQETAIYTGSTSALETSQSFDSGEQNLVLTDFVAPIEPSTDLVSPSSVSLSPTEPTESVTTDSATLLDSLTVSFDETSRPVSEAHLLLETAPESVQLMLVEALAEPSILETMLETGSETILGAIPETISETVAQPSIQPTVESMNESTSELIESTETHLDPAPLNADEYITESTVTGESIAISDSLVVLPDEVSSPDVEISTLAESVNSMQTTQSKATSFDQPVLSQSDSLSLPHDSVQQNLAFTNLATPIEPSATSLVSAFSTSSLPTESTTSITIKPTTLSDLLDVSLDEASRPDSEIGSFSEVTPESVETVNLVQSEVTTKPPILEESSETVSGIAPQPLVQFNDEPNSEVSGELTSESIAVSETYFNPALPLESNAVPPSADQYTAQSINSPESLPQRLAAILDDSTSLLHPIQPAPVEADSTSDLLPNMTLSNVQTTPDEVQQTLQSLHSTEALQRVEAITDSEQASTSQKIDPIQAQTDLNASELSDSQHRIDQVSIAKSDKTTEQLSIIQEHDLESSSLQTFGETVAPVIVEAEKPQVDVSDSSASQQDVVQLHRNQSQTPDASTLSTQPIPDSWSSLSELIAQDSTQPTPWQETLDSLDAIAQPDLQPDLQAEALPLESLEDSLEVDTPDQTTIQPKVDSPTAVTVSPDSEPADSSQAQSPTDEQLDQIASIIYSQLRQRFVIDRERQGQFLSGHSLWLGEATLLEQVGANSNTSQKFQKTIIDSMPFNTALEKLTAEIYTLLRIQIELDRERSALYF